MIMIDFSKVQLVDLTHTLDNNIPSWNGSCGFKHEVKMDYGQGCRVQSIKMHAGVGTHMDAPCHFFENARSVADINIQELFMPAVVINVLGQAHENYFISVDDIKNFENTYGKIPPRTCVIGYTGWASRWHDVASYRNHKSDGVMHFPGFSAEAADFLLEREIQSIAIDSLSPDGSNQQDFPVHKLILGADRYIIENIANANLLPPIGAYVGCFAIKGNGISEGAVRAVGFLKNNKTN